MRNEGYSIAVIGAGTLTGREVRSALEERQFPMRTRRWLALDTDFGVAVDDEEPIDPVSELALRDVDVVFMCGPEEASALWTPRATALGAVVIDLSQLYSSDVDVPLVVPEVNAAAVADFDNRRVLASPTTGATALSAVLRPIEDAGQLKRVVVAAYESVSGVGRGGIDELSRQTADLMNGRSTESEIFPHRIAFNLIPHVGEFLEAGASRGESLIGMQLRRILDLPDLLVSVTSVWVPAFYGAGYAVNIETERPADAAEIRGLLRESPGIVVIDDLGENAYPTLADTVETDGICVGRIRDDLTVPCGVNLWVTIDGIRKGAAVNAVQIAEILIREYL